MQMTQWGPATMFRTCRLMLLVLSLGSVAFLASSAMAEDRVRSAHHDEALVFFAEGELERAIEAARQAWTESRETFGAEDTLTFEAEVLWLVLRIHEKVVAGLPPDDLTTRLLAIKDKSIVRREIAYEMTWRYGPPAKEWPTATHVILTYVSHPNYFEGIYSSELAGHLETLGGGRVCVVMSVTYNAIGEDISRRTIEIGGMTRWKSASSYVGRQGNQRDFPSPWDQVDQRDAQCPGDGENR